MSIFSYLRAGGASIVVSAGGAKPNYGVFVSYADQLGKMVDAPLIASPRSTKNRKGKLNSGMYFTEN